VWSFSTDEFDIAFTVVCDRQPITRPRRFLSHMHQVQGFCCLPPDCRPEAAAAAAGGDPRGNNHPAPTPKGKAQPRGKGRPRKVELRWDNSHSTFRGKVRYR
jgi:hypothetical protein